MVVYIATIMIAYQNPQMVVWFSSEKEVVMVGVANRVEIWSKERWQECIDSYDDDMDEVAENMESLGFSI
jgi:DNA-binding transcriptional regulator/RsmH inhibitor MraZ